MQRSHPGLRVAPLASLSLLVPLLLVPLLCAWCAAQEPAEAPASPGQGAGQQTSRASELEQKVRSALEHNDGLGFAAPDFGADRRWLNVSRALSLKEDLRGRVVLVDFWTYCCINCLHVLPDLAYLEKKYAGQPFTVIGCHSAKFLNEAEAGNIRQAVLRHGIEHPVVVDEELEIWRKFDVRSWPTLVLIGPNGNLLYQLSGEGRRDVLDLLVGQALALYKGREGVPEPRPLPLLLERAREAARELAFPGKVLADADGGRLFISDSGHHRIVVTTLEGRFLRAFGAGAPGLEDGPPERARFRQPQGLALLGGQLLVADTENHALRSIDLETGATRTLAGNGEQGSDRSGSFPARKARLNSPWDLLVVEDDVLVAMAGPHQLWKYSPATEKVSVLAGDGSERKADGSFKEGAFAQPSGLARLGSTVFVADSESSSVRAVDLEKRAIQTLVGGTSDPRDLFHFGDEDGVGPGRRLQHPLGVLVHDGALYVADTYNHKVKVIDLQEREVRTLAGTGRPGEKDGPLEEAELHEPGGLAAVGRRLYVADTNNHRIRVIDLEAKTVATLPLEGVPLPGS